MNPNIDIDLLRAFLAVADHGSFTAASRVLNRSQSAVSMQIRRLEETIDGTLFERDSRNVALTRRGESLFGYARRMVSLNDEALENLRSDSIAGVVRIGVIEDYAAHTLPSILAGFMTAYPNVAFEMETGYTPSLLARLGKAFDVVLAMHPAGSGKGNVVRGERAVWIGSRQYEAFNRPVLPLALHPAGCQFRQAALDALDRAKRPWRLTYLSQSLAAIEGAVAAGLAVTVGKVGALPKGLSVLGKEQGLPRLPAFEISLHQAPRKTNPAAAAFAEHLSVMLRDGSV